MGQPPLCKHPHGEAGPEWAHPRGERSWDGTLRMRGCRPVYPGQCILASVFWPVYPVWAPGKPKRTAVCHPGLSHQGGKRAAGCCHKGVVMQNY